MQSFQPHNRDNLSARLHRGDKVTRAEINAVYPREAKMDIGSKILLAFGIACFAAVAFLIYYPVSY